MTQQALTEYMPAEDSFFDAELTTDLDLSKELTPSSYAVQIDGEWFGQDFTYLFKIYERLYAFFYSTQPRFVRTLSQNLQRLLRSPWIGGYSRVNLFYVLPRHVPGLHSLKVEHIKYASPGEVKFEAIYSVGESVRIATNALVENEAAIIEASKRINRTLTDTGLKRRDLSLVSDQDAPIGAIQRRTLEETCAEIARLLCATTELRALREHSPNIVVYAKAVLALIRQLSKLGVLQQQGLLTFSKKAP